MEAQEAGAVQKGEGKGEEEEVEVEVGRGVKVVVGRAQHLEEAGSGRCMTGAWMWDSALLLAEWLVSAAQADELQMTHTTRVIELGAGCTGLPGLTAALLGAGEVVLTDRPGQLLAVLQANVSANGLDERRVQVKGLEWGQEAEAEAFDVVLMSDVLYDVESVAALCRCIRRVSGPHSLIVMAYEQRLITDECLALLPLHGLLFAELPRPSLPPRWRHPDDPGILTIWSAPV
ncbi:hypothetical protein L7F22_067355 [Adiantum nelumboides]|nr:hypothetical protein [Adiantum nelumboides]